MVIVKKPHNYGGLTVEKTGVVDHPHNVTDSDAAK